MNASRDFKIGVAFSGGIAYTVAHIGVLKALEQGGVTIDCAAGTSGGAFVGACYAAGMTPDELIRAAGDLRWRQLARLQVPRLGLFSSERIEKFITRYIGEITFSDLRIPFSAVCADVITGRQVVLNSGPVASAVRASCSIPQVFAPVERDGPLLTDGGLADKLPVECVVSQGADIVIGSDVGYKSRRTHTPRNMIEAVLGLMSFVGEDRAARQRALADFMIYPALQGYSALNFTKYKESVEAGERAAREVVPQVLDELDYRRSLLGSSQWSTRTDCVLT